MPVDEFDSEWCAGDGAGGLMDAEFEVSHCCEMMGRELADERVPITFSSKFREYALQLFDESGYTNVYDVIAYCPWCGIELPRSLRDEWFEMAPIAESRFRAVRRTA
jgi:hypothetical protein